MSIVEELRSKKSRDNRELLDRAADRIEELELLLINQNKSNNFEVKSNEELFKQALVEGLNRRFDREIEEAKKIEQIEETAKILCGMKNGCDGCMWDKVHCNERNYAEEIYNAGYRKQEWISVEDRLPEVGGTYLIVLKEKYEWEKEWEYHVDAASFTFEWDCFFHDWDEGQEIQITHWMPLPQPPKMKGGAE